MRKTESLVTALSSLLKKGGLAFLTCSVASRAWADSTAETTWAGAGDGVSWIDEANWDAGVPTAESMVAFPNTGATISLGNEVREIAGFKGVVNNEAPLVLNADEGGGLTDLEEGEISIGRVGHGSLRLVGGSHTFAGHLRAGWYYSSWNTADPSSTGRVDLISAEVVAKSVKLGIDHGYGLAKFQDSNVQIQNGVVVGSTGDGLLELASGDYSQLKAIVIGESNDSRGTLIVRSSATLSQSSLTLGNASNAYAEVELDGGKIYHTNANGNYENLTIGNSSNSVARVVVQDGSLLAAGNDIWIGNYGSGSLTINGGEVSCTYWIDIVRKAENAGDQSNLNFNGGLLKVGKISTSGKGSGNPVFNWNGGVFEPNGNYSDILPQSAIAVNVLSGGAIVDVETIGNRSSYTIDHDLKGNGFIRKLGSAKLTLTGKVDLKRGFDVREGELVLTSGQVVPSTRLMPMKEVSISETASLDLNGAELYVQSYVLAGVAQKEGTYEAHNGVIHVVPTDVATATWTNATGDNDKANPENWEVFTFEGARLWDVLPQATTKITIPYHGALYATKDMPSEDVVWSISGEAKFHGDAAVPLALQDAIAWYDLADESTVTAEGGVLMGIRNKGTAGAALDGELGGSLKPAYGLHTLNGLNVMSMTNSHGFISKQAAGIAGEQDRTLLVLSRQMKDAFMNSEGTAYYNQNFPLGIETGGDFGTFRMEWGSSWQRYFYNGKTLTIKGQQDWDEWAILSMDSENSVVSGSHWTASQGLVSSTDGGTQTNLETSAEAKIAVGYRRQYATTSVGQVAEAIVIGRKLTDDEMTACRTYLRTKWFDYIDAALNPKALTLDEAQLDLNGQTLSLTSVSGSGTLSNGKVEGLSVLRVTVAADGTASCVTLPNGLDVSSLRIEVTGARSLPLGKHLTILQAGEGEMSGRIDRGQIHADAPRAYCSARVSGGAVTLCRVSGLCVVIR